MDDFVKDPVVWVAYAGEPQIWMGEERGVGHNFVLTLPVPSHISTADEPEIRAPRAEVNVTLGGSQLG